MTRWGVFRLRLAASMVVLLPLVAVVRLLWYPGGYAGLAGVYGLLSVLAAVSLVVGAGLTTLMYRPGKRGLWFDIVVLAVLELAAIGWAVYEIHTRRPAFTVFAVDRFEVVTAREVDMQAVLAGGIEPRPAHAPRLVYAQMPSDPAARSRLVEETVIGGMADIDRRPEFWRPYAAGVTRVLAIARPLVELTETDVERKPVVARWLQGAVGDATDYVYVPIRGRRRDAAMVLHVRTGYPVDIIDVDPW